MQHANPVLTGALEAMNKTSFQRHAHRTMFLAATYIPWAGDDAFPARAWKDARSRRRHPEALPDAALPYDGFRLLTVGARFCDAVVNLRKRIPVVLYRPVLDLLGTGRVNFVPEAVYDASARKGSHEIRKLDPVRQPSLAAMTVLMLQAIDDVQPGDALPAIELPGFYWAFHGTSRVVYEPGVATEVEWAQKMIKIGTMRAWPAEFFARAFDARYDVHPLSGALRPGGTPDADCDGWVVRDGALYPVAQKPDAVYTFLNGFGGRTVRNPAFAVLQKAGIIPGAMAYHKWRARLDVDTPDGGRILADPDLPGSATHQVRAAIEAHIGDDPQREEKLIGDMAAACASFLLDVTDRDQLLALLDSPWQPVTADELAKIQVIQLQGPPCPETLEFFGKTTAAPLYHLGAPFDQVEPRRVDETFRQIRLQEQGRGGGQRLNIPRRTGTAPAAAG